MKAMNSLKYLGLAALASSVAFATNITINDPFTNSGAFSTPYSNNAGVPEAGRVEAGSTAHNSWDLASFTLSGSSLSMNGGFNFTTGVGVNFASSFAMGDIFVYDAVPFNGATPYLGKDDWTHVIHFERTAAGSNPKITGATVNYQILTKAAATGYIYTQNPSALIIDLPWMVGNAAQPSWTPGTYSASGNPALSLLNTTFMNSITVDVSSILTGDTQYFHATMRCGNDILWGRVPDGGFTLVLLSLGLGGLALAVRRRK